MARAGVTLSHRDRIAWTFASGLVSALEGRLLPQRATLELLNAGGLDDLLARVRQTAMFADLGDHRGPFELAEEMQACAAAAFRRLGDASPTRSVAGIFLLPIEWQAFRGFLRAKALGLERGNAPGSAVTDAVWEQCWATADVAPPFDLFAASAAALRDSGPREELEPQVADAITSLYEARDIRRAAHATGSPVIAGWVDTLLKLRLALALLRCRVNEWGNVLGADAFDDLGLSRTDVQALLAPERRDWRAPFVSLGFAAILTIPEEEALPAAAIERLTDDAITDPSRGGRGLAFGPEPVFAYLWALRIEALNLKTLVAGVAAGLSREAISKDIRQTYV